MADLKHLGKDLGKKGVIMGPADKGRATVMMDLVDYEEKMRPHVDNPDMLKLPTDPTEQFRRELIATLEAMKPLMNEHT